MARLKYFFILSGIALLPQTVFAAQTFKSVVDKVTGILNLAIPVVGLMIILAVGWGFVKYIFSNADPSSKADGKTIIVWGLIAVFVVVSVWGLVAILRATIIQ